MNSSPGLAVAVKVRAPAADAPIHADIAANSLSTLRNWQEPSAPVFTICESPSTMWVCGEIGYAQMTSGRQAATVSATAREPSICLGIDRLLAADELVGGLCRRSVAGRRRAGEALVDRGDDRAEADDPGQRREPSEQRRTGQRTAQVLPGELAGRDGDHPAAGDRLHAQLGGGVAGVQQDGA